MSGNIISDTRAMLEALKREGWTDGQLAAALGVSTTSIWKWRTTARSPVHGVLINEALHELLAMSEKPATALPKVTRAKPQAAGHPDGCQCSGCRMVLDPRVVEARDMARSLGEKLIEWDSYAIPPVLAYNEASDLVMHLAQVMGFSGKDNDHANQQATALLGRCRDLHAKLMRI